MTTRDFIYHVFAGTTSKTSCSSVWAEHDSDGDVIVYSYGRHYPLAKIINGKGYVNNRGYSMTTSKHIGWAFSALHELLGYENVIGVPLKPGLSLTLDGIQASAWAEYHRIINEMNSKKRTNTWVYQNLERQKQTIEKALV